MMDLSKVRSYYIACGYTDLRLGISLLIFTSNGFLLFCVKEKRLPIGRR